ncbi:hypothetical protein ACOMHN_037725 [Nucella lapillus]
MLVQEKEGFFTHARNTRSLREKQGPARWRSTRFILAYLACSGMCVVYFQRVSLSLAIVCMVNHTALHIQHLESQGIHFGNEMVVGNSSSTFSQIVDIYIRSPNSSRDSHHDDQRCPVSEKEEQIPNSDEDGPFAWDKQTQGLLLASIYIGYTIFLIPGNYVIRRFGVRLTVGYSIAVMSVCHVLCHPAALLSPWAVLALRIFMGGCTAFTLVGMYGMWATWAPTTEQSQLLGITFSGEMIAIASAFPLSALLCRLQDDVYKHIMELGILHNSPPSTKRGCRAGRLYRLWHGLPPAQWPCTRSQHHSVPSRNLHPLMVPPFLQPHPDLQSAVGNAPLSSKHPAQLPTTDCLLSIISPMGGQPSDAPALSPPSPLQQGGQSSNAPALSPPSPLPQGGQPIALALSPLSPPPQGGQPSDAPGLSPSSSTLLLCPSDSTLNICHLNSQSAVKTGGLGLVWSVVWFFLMTDSPEHHPRISANERRHIINNRADVTLYTEKASIPWKSMLLSSCFWAIAVAQFAFYWGYFMLVSNLPTFLYETMHFDIQSNGVYSMLPYITLFLVVCGTGFIFDSVIRRRLLSKIAVRRLSTTLAFTIPAVLLVVMSHLQCHQVAAVVVLLAVAVGVTGLSMTGGFFVNPFDIAPRYAATICTVISTIGVTAGIISPYLVAAVTVDQTREQWQMVFYVTAGVYLSGSFIFCLLAKVDVQPWAHPFMQEVEYIGKDTKIITVVEYKERDTKIITVVEYTEKDTKIVTTSKELVWSREKPCAV